MKTAYYDELRKVGLTASWLDNILAGGVRSRYIFLRPERLPMPLIMQLSLIVGLPLEKTIEVLWKHNIPASNYFTNKAFLNATLVTPPPSPIRSRRMFALKPHSDWFPKHLRDGQLAEAVYAHKYRPQDLDRYMRFPAGGTYNWLRKPLMLSTIPDFIRLAALMNCSFSEAFSHIMCMDVREIDVPLVLPPKITHSRKTTIASFGAFDMLRYLEKI